MIKLSLKEKMQFVNSYIQNEMDLSIIGECSNKEHEQSVLEDFEYLLELSKEKNIEKWYKSLKNKKLINLEIADLKERVIETKNGKVLLGIRYLGKDINNPFVNIWCSFPIQKELDNIIEIAKKEFKIFKPKFVRFNLKPNSILSKKYDKYKASNFFTNSITRICEKDLPINFKEISLKKVKNLDFYDWYKKIYDEFHKENKYLKFIVSSNSKADFENNIKDNLIYFIEYKNKRIGLISGASRMFLGKKAIYMYEIVIEKEFKGKKLATATQRKFIEINKNNYHFIWGTISNKNIPSYKNALRIGRKIISTEILLPI